MGGCYESFSSCSSSYSRPVSKPRAKPNPQWQQELRSFTRSSELSDLLSAYKSFSRSRRKGFFAKLSEVQGIKDVKDIPKEFPEIEYEVKFDVQPQGNGAEPTVEQYLDAFDFPVGGISRFLKDPVNNIAVGINHFIGDDINERLVVIEKGRGTYLKEKGRVIPMNTGVPYEQIIVKRKEERHASPIEEILSKFQSVTSEKGVEYKGKIRKAKGDAFLLDTNDGRLYSMSFTRSHLVRNGDSAVTQRQLEVEYAGHIPGFKEFKENSEQQIARGMVDLAKYIYMMYNGAPIISGWTMDLALTSEKKYDFVIGIDVKHTLPPMFTTPLLVHNRG